MKKKDIGNKGEQVAAEYLLNIGYLILDRNYSTKYGEIDIIAIDGEYLVFAEVKLRSSAVYGTGADAVDYRKQKHIIDTATYYISQNNYNNVQVRFDVIELNKDYCVNHIINAFDVI